MSKSKLLIIASGLLAASLSAVSHAGPLGVGAGVNVGVGANVGAGSSLGAGASIGAGTSVGAGANAGAMASQHMSAEGMANSNGVAAASREFGQARAAERRSDSGMSHEKADPALAKHKPRGASIDAAAEAAAQATAQH